MTIWCRLRIWDKPDSISGKHHNELSGRWAASILPLSTFLLLKERRVPETPGEDRVATSRLRDWSHFVLFRSLEPFFFS